MIAHPAGPRHAEEIHHGETPPRPQSPDELLLLAPNVWPRNTVRESDGVVSIAGVRVTDIADEYGTPTFVIANLLIVLATAATICVEFLLRRTSFERELKTETV